MRGSRIDKGSSDISCVEGHVTIYRIRTISL